MRMITVTTEMVLDYSNNNNDIYVLIVAFFELVYQIITQIHVPYNGLYDGEQRLLSVTIQVRNDVYKMENHNDNKDYLSNRNVVTVVLFC